MFAAVYGVKGIFIYVRWMKLKGAKYKSNWHKIVLEKGILEFITIFNCCKWHVRFLHTFKDLYLGDQFQTKEDKIKKEMDDSSSGPWIRLWVKWFLNEKHKYLIIKLVSSDIRNWWFLLKHEFKLLLNWSQMIFPWGLYAFRLQKMMGENNLCWSLWIWCV